MATFPNFKGVATTLRNARTASVNDWGAVLHVGGQLYQSRHYEGLEIFDRVGGGDSFASGLIYGLLSGRDPQWAVDCGAAHGALAMTTPGDTTMARLKEVERVMRGGSARVAR
jgi:2-dehydro-3-deoxygluconokinase